MRINFSIGKNKKAKLASTKLIRHYGQVELSEAEIIVAVGGDGAMLNALRESISSNLPVFGLNRGNIGFLMNNFSEFDLIKRLEKAKEIIVHPLEKQGSDVENNEGKEMAVNEVSIFRSTHQSAMISIKIDEY